MDEPPLAPTSITFSDTKQRSINVAWAAPNNTGRPPIEKYQLQYRSHSDDPWPQVETANIIDNITTTNHTVTPLDRDTQYDFRVRALNDEGTGPWSEPSPHSTNANQPPQITSGHTASIAENAPSNQLVTTVMTTDPDIADGGTWGFTTDGAHAAKFHITQASSLLTITVNDNLDYEQLPLTDKTLSFTLNVTDNQGGQDSALVTITVTDVDEPPARPAQPTVTVPAAPRTLTITWSPPTNTGPPITSYTLQYRKGTSGPFADVHTGPALSHTHSGLTANSRYDYQVLATNDEGSSPYSPVGHGTTPPNMSPTFGAVRSYENDLQEDIGNTPGSIQTLKPVNATDPDNGTITYTLEGPDRNSFTIDETTGAIQTKARVFDHESKATYSFQARASDNHRGETPLHDQVDITVNILDLNELPLTPTDVVAEHPTRFQYQIRWSPPENTGRPPIDHYTIEWTTDRNSPPTSKETATTSSTVAALLPDTVYSTRVTAHNADGDGQPSQWQDIRTLPNNPPVFAATSRTRILDENNAPQANVGSPIPVTDPDSDTIAYSIDGTNPGGFTIEPTTGQIKAGNRIYNHEQTPSYTITVTANDQQGGSTSQNVAITIRDVDEPPHKVQLPTASNQSLTSITFTWNEPTNTGPPVTGYEYQYRKGSAGWRPAQQTTATTITLPGLDQDSPYSFHVSAVNDEGTGPYSDPAGSRTNQNSPPAFPNATTTLTVNENSTSGTVGTITATDPDGETLTYSVDGADETDFNQDFSLNTATATITIKPTATIDHETKPSYSVNITARDPSGGAGNVALTIVVTNVNEPGLVTLTPTSPTAARTLTAALTDPDQDISGVTWTWAWAPISAGPFTTISSATNAAYTPLPADIGRYLKATATYADHFGAGQTAEKVSDNPVRNNPPPVFPNPAVTFTVDENSTAGTVGTITATDPDGETITYSVGGADETDFNQDFSLNTSTATITIKPTATIDHETRPSYTVVVTATDSANVTTTVNLTINVNDLNEAGAVSLAPTTPTVAKPLTATVNDPDGTATGATWTWSWNTTRTGSFTTISGASGKTYTPATADAGRYLKASVSYTDPFGSGQSAEQVSDNAVAANPPPVFANNSVTLSVNENTTSGTVGTITATDPDGDAITHSVGGTDETAFNEDFSLDASNGLITVRSDATIDHETRPSYSVTITATDPYGGTDQIDVTITVTNVDEPGTVNLSQPTPVVGEPLTATLGDPDGGITSDTWSWSWSATSTGSFTTITGANSPTYTPVQPNVGRYLKATVSYTDSLTSGRSASQTADNATSNNPPPEFADNSVTLSVNENTTSGTVGRITATDPDSDAITYSVGGTDQSAFKEDFSLDSSNGEITVKSDATIDHETKPSYSVTITATDPYGGTDTVTLTINVTNVDEAGMVTLSRTTPTVGKPLTATLTDPDGGITGTTWSWSSSATSTGNFTTVSGANTATYTPASGDVGRYLKAAVSYTDSSGSGKNAETTSTNAVATNPPPVFPNPAVTFTVDENSTAGTLGTITATDPDGDAITYSVGGTDQTDFNEDFSLNTSNGLITVRSDATIDHENRPSYSVTITATDPYGGTDEIDVTITVTNVDEPGTVNLSQPTPVVGEPLTATLDDLDGTVTSATWRWSWSATSTGSFTTINGANSANYTPATADARRYLKASVSYTDPFSSGRSAEKVSNNAVAANPPPVFANNSVTLSVNENTTSGTVGTITATDPDSDAITYSVGGTDESAFKEDFSLNASNGEITVNSDANIDHEIRPSYSVRITATDPYGGTDEIDVTITVTNVDEPGVITLSRTTPTVGKSLTATLSDPDGGVTSTTWNWSSSVTFTGSFTTVSGANTATYMPTSGDVGRYLKAAVSYTDSSGSGKNAEKTSTNTVATNPPPVFADNSVTLSVNENATSGTVGTITATDPDGDAITYSVGGTDETAFKEDFSLDASNGLITVRSDATIDHEARPSYSVTITATDPYGGTDTVALTITVTNVDEPGTVTLSQPAPIVGEPLTATLSDPDGTATGATWNWSWNTTSTGSFTTINGANSVNYTPATADAGRYLKASVSYTDPFGSGQSAEQVSDNAVAANPSPEFADNSVTLSVNENATSGTVGTITATDPDGDAITYSVDGTDETAFNEDFSLDASNGLITVRSDATIDHETRPSYSVRITATDPYGGNDEIDLTITVTNVDEPGMVTLSRTTPTVGKPLTANLTDPDGGITGTTWSWSSSVTSTGSFTTVSGANNATYTPVQPDVGRYLKLVVTYTDSSGSGKNAETTSTNAVVANPPPAFPNHSVTFTVKENSTAGTVGRVRANDPDNDPITYSVVGTDETDFNQDFRLNPSTGRITVRSNASINQDTKLMYSVTITATDPYGGTDTITVTIYVTDMPVNVTPHPPINLQASPTDDHVTLTWQGSVDNFHVSGYRIQRYQGHRSGWQTVTPFQPAANQFPWDNPGITETYLDTNILPSTPYRYRIRSMNEQGISTHYAGINVETAVEPPGLRIFADHGKVTIGWDTPEDDTITGYRILRRIQWGNQETPVGDTERGDTGWTDRQVSPNTAYAYRLQALRDGRPGARSRYLFTLTPRIATPTVVVSEPEGQDLAAGTETIGRIDVGGSVTGTIDSVDDRDWFAVEMEAGETYHARLSYMTKDGLRSFTNGRVVLGCLMGADGTDSPDICLNKGRVNFEVEQAGTYYIVIQPRWYQTHLGHPEMPTEYELELDHDVDLPQDSSIAAPYGALRTSSEVEVGTWVSGQLHNGDLADNHRVQLQQGHWYRVPVFFNYGPETDGILANAGTVRIGTGQQNSRWSNTSPHLFRASQTGTHYLNVARETDISTIYITQHTSYYQEATYKFLVEDLGTLAVEESTSSN